MYESNNTNNWLKHWDFMLLDVIGVQVAFCIAYYLRFQTLDVWQFSVYRNLAITLALLTLLCGQLCNTYQGILRRSTTAELKKVGILVSVVMLIIIFLMFAIKTTSIYSRLLIGYLWVVSVILLFIIHIAYKKLLNNNLADKNSRKLILILTPTEIPEIEKNIVGKPHPGVDFMGAVIIGTHGKKDFEIKGLRLVSDENGMLEFFSKNAVEGVMLSKRAADILGTEIIEDCIDMGIPVHRTLYEEDDRYGTYTVENIAGYAVLTSTLKLATPRQLFMKRVMDIAGGLVGSIFAIIIMIFTAPVIYIQSPGPILFKQTRMGRNGKEFKIYKLRTMYTDAEERKAELMKENKMDGPIFKIDNDPRIYPFGNFLRKTSLDEFPQFFNVVKGDMSLVGTRPPTLDEYNKYEYHHKKRLAIKPGITGMWQVSGRSKITDFEEIVRLDTEYITNWRLSLDIKILFKTVGVLFTKDGAQ